MEANKYSFTAMRGHQASKAYYVLLCPLKLIPKVFSFADESVPPQLRAQRILNRTRIPVIARYICDNPTDYILSSLCASVDGEIEFEAAHGALSFHDIGFLHIGMSATILINDGQHRRAAIEEAIRERPDIGDETISVVLFPDYGLTRSQQMFADLNVHATKPTKSIRLLYNHRDEVSQLSRDVFKNVALFREFVDLESTSLSNRTLKLFTFSSLHQAVCLLSNKRKNALPYAEQLDRIVKFWNEVIRNMPDWQAIQNKTVHASELRRDYIHSHGIALQAIAMVGERLMSSRPKAWRARLAGLRQVNWSRSNESLWEGRALMAGKISKSTQTIGLVANVICKAVGLPLSKEAQDLEDRVSVLRRSTKRRKKNSP